MMQIQSPRNVSVASGERLIGGQGGTGAEVSSEQDQRGDDTLSPPPAPFPVDDLAQLRDQQNLNVSNAVTAMCQESSSGNSKETVDARIGPFQRTDDLIYLPSTLGSMEDPRPSIDSYTHPPDYTELHPDEECDPLVSGETDAGQLPSYPMLGSLGPDLNGSIVTGHDSRERASSAHTAPESKGPLSILPTSPRSIRRSHHPSRLSLSTPIRSEELTSIQDEKRKIDLDQVATAVDRMLHATPRLNDQRYVPRAGSSKPPTNEIAPTGETSLALAETRERKWSPTKAMFDFARAGLGRDRWETTGKDGLERVALGKGKGKAVEDIISKENEMELTQLWTQIEKAHGHREFREPAACHGQDVGSWTQFYGDSSGLDHQSFDKDTDAQVEKTIRKRESFFKDLLASTSVGRLNDQDAVSPTTCNRTALDLMTMKEFVSDLRAVGRTQTRRDFTIATNAKDEAEDDGAGHNDPMFRQRSTSLPINKYTGRNQDTSLPLTPTSATTLYDHEESSESIELLRDVGNTSSSDSHSNSNHGFMQRQVSRGSIGSRRSTYSAGAGAGGGGAGTAEPDRAGKRLSTGGGILKRLGLSRRGSSASGMSAAVAGGGGVGSTGEGRGREGRGEDGERLMIQLNKRGSAGIAL